MLIGSEMLLEESVFNKNILLISSSCTLLLTVTITIKLRFKPCDKISCETLQTFQSRFYFFSILLREVICASRGFVMDSKLSDEHKINANFKYLINTSLEKIEESRVGSNIVSNNNSILQPNKNKDHDHDEVATNRKRKRIQNSIDEEEDEINNGASSIEENKDMMTPFNSNGGAISSNYSTETLSTRKNNDNLRNYDVQKCNLTDTSDAKQKIETVEKATIGKKIDPKDINPVERTSVDAHSQNFRNDKLIDIINKDRLMSSDHRIDDHLNDRKGTKESQVINHNMTADKSSAQSTYLAPEQALVTSVELVVPAPTAQPAVRFDASIFNSPSSSLITNDKTDGCATDSSLNLRIPTNLSLATVTSDTLLAERRRAIWAPHGEDHGSSNLSQGSEEVLDSGASGINSTSRIGSYEKENGTVKDGVHLDEHDIYNAQASQHTQHSSDLLLQIEKEHVSTTGFVQMLPLQQQPHNAVHHQYEQNIIQQHHHQHINEHHLQSTMYTQIMQQENINVQHQQQTHYPSYHQQPQHYSHEHLFGIQAHHLPPQHHLECHSHQPQQQIQESYHELLMDEFHEDPNSAYKLSLSPNAAKPENQDDGYETSAGDVLTPNSHSSSTHSVTPQHQMQLVSAAAMPQSSTSKHEELQSHKIQPSSNSKLGHNQANLNIDQLPLREDINSNINGRTGVTNDPYSFIADDMRLMSPSSCHTNSASGTIQPGGNPLTCLPHNESGKINEIYTLGQHQHDLVEQRHFENSEQMRRETSSLNLHNVDGSNEPSQNVLLDTHVHELSGKPAPKRRGRKKKIVGPEGVTINQTSVSSDTLGGDNEAGLVAGIDVVKPKERKKHDRFNGMSEAEVIKRTIPDHLCDNLDIIIVGINPGLFAAYKGHHYAGPGNHFWKCLYLSGLTQEQMNADEDHKLMKHGIGFTNMVARATKGSADLTRKEIKEGSRILLEKLQRFRPKIAVFNGKLIFEVFSGKKEFHFGRQPDRVEGTDTYIWVMPSSSARCAQLPRAADKVPFYAALKKFRDYLNGLIPHMEESECIFTEQRIRQCCEQESLKIITGIEHHAEQSSLLFGDNVEGVKIESDISGCPRQNDKILQFANNNATNIHERESGFQYSNDDQTQNNNVSGIIRESRGSMNEGYLANFGANNNIQPVEKKKRGRPKKIKGQEIIDPATGNKITISNQHIAHHDFNNILNLSLIGNGGAITGQTTPKKKRGRPKKLKPQVELMSSKLGGCHQQHASQHNTTQVTCTTVSTMPMHTLSNEQTSSPQSHQVPPSLYNTPPPSHILYTATASPMASPALNSNYSRGTPPVTTQGTPPVGEQHLLPDMNKNPTCLDSPTDPLQVSGSTALVPAGVRDPHLGETPPPSSPNICSIDFESPTTNTFNDGRSISVEHAGHSQEHYHSHHPQQWLSPQNHQPAHKTLHHVQQAQQSPAHQQQYEPYQVTGSQEQPELEHWQRQQHSYEEHSNTYMSLPSPHLHSTLPINAHGHPGPISDQAHLQSQIVLSDVARKSLSGLESLVDQIPSINEHEASSIASATAAAAAAAVESRLLGLQQQQQLQQQQKRCTSSEQTSAQPESFDTPSSSAANNSILSTNFSVSNLAASSSSSTTGTNTSNGNGHTTQSDYIAHGVTTASYHHPNLISAALASAPHPHPHTHPHTQLYMDPHITSHITHMPVNSMYGAAPAPPHHHPAYGPTAPQHGPTNGAEFGHNHYAQPATLHMPSPNYPYGHYSHTPPQNNYPSYAHHPHHHPHSTHHGHGPHHLSVFERLKPSDISGYTGF